MKRPPPQGCNLHLVTEGVTHWCQEGLHSIAHAELSRNLLSGTCWYSTLQGPGESSSRLCLTRDTQKPFALQELGAREASLTAGRALENHRYSSEPAGTRKREPFPPAKESVRSILCWQSFTTCQVAEDQYSKGPYPFSLNRQKNGECWVER